MRYDPRSIDFKGPFRTPDQKKIGGYETSALWWGPSRKKGDAEAFTEVKSEGEGYGETFEVSEYTFLGGYEHYIEGEREWTKQTVHFSFKDFMDYMHANEEEKLIPRSVIYPKKQGDFLKRLQIAAGFGVAVIGYYGGQEEDLTSEELP